MMAEGGSPIVKIKIYTVNGTFESEFEIEGTVEDAIVI